MAGKAGKSGRQSDAALAVVATLPGHAVRPEPPAHLTDAQAAEWRAVVDVLPADWFGRETHGLLESYCRHVSAEREIDRMIEETKVAIVDPISLIDALDKLFKMRERESRAASSMATRLRITNQALTNHKASRTPGDGGGAVKKPWE